MKISFGTDLYGELYRPDGSIKTKFFHIAHLPLVPLGSYRVYSDDNEGFVGTKIGWHLGSLALAYFRIWGFLAALGLTAWSVYMFDRRTVPWSTLAGVPVTAMLLMAGVIGSWHLFAVAPHPGRGKSAAKWIGIPVAIMLAGSAFLWHDRMGQDAMVAQSRAEEAAKQAALHKEIESKRTPQEQEDRINELNAKAYAIATQMFEKTSWTTKACDDDKLAAVAGDGAGRHLAVADYETLVYRTNDWREAHRWLMSPAVAAIQPITPSATLDTLAQHPFWAVMRVEDVEGKRGKRALVGKLAIYDFGNRALLCETKFAVDSTKGDGASPPPASVQTAFKAKAREQLKRISKVLQIYDDSGKVATR